MAAIAPDAPGLPASPPSPSYARYVLVLLTLTYVLNFVDRQVLSILAVDLKRDLGMSDADLGFLYGTAFGVFFALFGIPLGRLADTWHRVRLMTAGLAIWSAATAVSGFARTGAVLTGARIGVGVGEATAGPCAYSLISDYFPKASRGTALAIYSSGIFIGGGLSLLIGGFIVQGWDAAFPERSGPLGLVGWQAAFLAVGVPGLLLALVVSTIREPMRGAADGLSTQAAERPFRGFADELLTVIPPFTFVGAARRGAGALIANLAVASLLALFAFVMIRLVGPAATPIDYAQWIGVAVGFYAVYSWASALRRRDRPTFALIWGTPALLCAVLGYGLIALLSYSSSFFAPTYARQVLGVDPREAGLILGLIGALAGFVGVVGGGRLSDMLRARNPSGRVVVILLGLVLPIVPLLIAFTTRDVTTFYITVALAQLTSPMALGAAAATTQDLVLPRMRGAATATFFLGTTLIGLSLGPYMAGFLSKATGDLGAGVLWLLVVVPISLAALVYLYRVLPGAEASQIERARAAGEPV